MFEAFRKVFISPLWCLTIKGALIDQIQKVGFSFNGILLNSAAYTHTSVGIGDAVKAINAPVIEVHISNIYAREDFRRKSLTSEAVNGVICLIYEEGSILTLTFYGSNKVVQNYNVMGIAKAALETSVKYLSVDLGKKKIRVNAISASPMRTLSGAAITNSRDIFNYTKSNSALKRNVELNEIGNSALYLVSISS